MGRWRWQNWVRVESIVDSTRRAISDLGLGPCGHRLQAARRSGLSWAPWRHIFPIAIIRHGADLRKVILYAASHALVTVASLVLLLASLSTGCRLLSIGWREGPTTFRTLPAACIVALDCATNGEVLI